MVSRNPHISFAVRGVHHHSRGCCTAAQAPRRRECDHRRRSSLHYAPYRGVYSCWMQTATETTDPSTMDIGGCLILLQPWVLYWMPFLASISHQLYVFPLVNK
ncbi:hypothetical protein Gotur_030818 [Gossypium turneri]